MKCWRIKPDFKTIAQDFIEYIRGAELLIHNAPFDVGFMDYEFRKLGLDIKTTDICLVTDTLQMARQMYPGKRNSLDALCDRLGIDNSKTNTPRCITGCGDFSRRLFVHDGRSNQSI